MTPEELYDLAHSGTRAYVLPRIAQALADHTRLAVLTAAPARPEAMTGPYEVAGHTFPSMTEDCVRCGCKWMHRYGLPCSAPSEPPGNTGQKCHAAPTLLNTTYRCLLPKNHGGECHYTRVRHG